jgi:hypothetical protein
VGRFAKNKIFVLIFFETSDKSALAKKFLRKGFAAGIIRAILNKKQKIKLIKKALIAQNTKHNIERS